MREDDKESRKIRVRGRKTWGEEKECTCTCITD